jgi:hypothetical protein
MNRLILPPMWLSVVTVLLLCRPLTAAEDKQSPDQSPKAKESLDKPADTKPLVTPAKKTPASPLAPGVMITIEPDAEVGETVSRHDVVELLAVDKNFDWAKNADFRREIWALQFKFKPMRMISVDVPQPSGMMQRKLIWYMVYSVTNTGKILVPAQAASLPYENELADKQKVYEIKTVEKPIHFIPEFLLEGHNRLKDKDTEAFTKSYPDRVIPVADAAIQLREGYGQKLHTSVEMNREIAVGQTVWGAATWEDIDPKIVWFSVYVTGLTNAYRWTDAPGEYKAGDPIGKGRKLLRKTLKLNFWRPGDEFFETEDEIRYGIPGRLDYEWVYR